MDKDVKKIWTFLKTVPLFQDIDEQDLLYMAENTTQHVYPKSAIIMEKGATANNFFIVRSGRVEEIVTDQNQLSVTAKGNRATEHFGETSLLIDIGYATSAIAASRATLLKIPKKVFTQVAWKNKEIIQRVLRNLLTRLQHSGEKIIPFKLFNAEGRLAYVLLEHLSRNGVGDKTVEITQEELSVQCGIARQTVSLLLNSWKRLDYLDIARGKLKINRPEALTDIFLSDDNIR